MGFGKVTSDESSHKFWGWESDKDEELSVGYVQEREQSAIIFESFCSSRLLEDHDPSKSTDPSLLGSVAPGARS